MPDTQTADMPLAPSTSESSIVTTLGVPMPTPGTPTAPHFKGKRVEDFLDSLEQHADSARVPHSQLPGYVLRYCHMKVRIVIEGSNVWAGDDWVTARTFLADLYSSNDSIPVNSPDRLRQWSLKHGESGIVLSRRDVDKYYREFTALSSGLAPTRMLQNEISLCFYRGIPTVLRMKIKKRIPATNLKTSSPPSISSLLGWLRAEFDEEDLDAKIGPVSLDLDSETDTSSSESDDDIDKIPVKRKKKKPTKKVAFEKTVPAVPIVEPVGISPVDKLTRQMEELRLEHAEFLRSVKVASASHNPSSTQPVRDSRCFFCDCTTHRLGLQYCPEVKVCLNEGLVAYTPLGRLARPDGSELPRAFGSEGGVAKILREQKAASSHLKGKGREASRDLPPHMANYAGLLFDGQEVLGSEVFDVSTSLVVPAWRAQPSLVLAVTRSQKDKETRFDLIKRPEKKDFEAKSLPKNQDRRTHPPTPTLSNLGPPPSNPRPPIAPVQSTPQAFNLRPPKENTEDAFKNRRATPSKPKDVEMKDANPKAKSNPAYHFTSDIQEMYDLDKIVREKVNKTIVHLELGELLALSAFLQKSVSNLTKTRREYNTKPVVASVVEVLEEAEWDEEEFTPELVGGYDSDDEEYFRSLPVADSSTSSGYIESRIGLEFDEAAESKEEIMIRYASAVKIHPTPQPLFAMITGRFKGKFAGLDVVFMVDTGSELNLMSQEFYNRTSLAINLDGTRWSLKGINGRPVPLGGCVRDAEIKISGRRFDHHVFVSREGTGKQEIILGQPWLQWYSASIQYTRQGSMNMRVWQDGDGDKHGCHQGPSILIPLCTPNAPRNTTTLNMDKHPRIEEVVDVDAEK